MKDKIISDVRNLFEQEEDYYKSVRVGTFYRDNYIKVMVIERKPYQSKNTLKKLNRI